MNRVLQYDQIDFAPTKITQRDDPILGSITTFHDIVIAREIIHQYDDGWAYKPAQELQDAVWTAEGRWVIIGRHPETGIMSNRDDIGGRTVNVRFTKSLIDPKTKRTNNRGILVDLEVFDNRADPATLAEMKSGIRRDVSIGFFFDQDAVPGVIDDAKHPLNGIAYDYVQRNIMIDHTAAALETGTGRCPMPTCGIGADAFKRLVTGDPFAGFPNFEACIQAQMKRDPDLTREQAAGTCAVIEQRSKEKHKSDEGEDFKPTDDDNLSMKETVEAVKGQLKDILAQLDSLEVAEDDLVSEEAQGNAENMTESMRARAFFTISDKEWDALSEDEKNDYISRLPPKKVRAGGEELSDRDSTDEDCEDCDEEDEHKGCPEGETWSEEEGKCVSTDAEEDAEQESDEDEEIELPSTDQVVKDTEKVLADIERLVG